MAQATAPILDSTIASAKAAASHGLPADQVASYLLKREELGSTGIGRGVAIPHARLPDLQRPYGGLCETEAADRLRCHRRQPVDIVFGQSPRVDRPRSTLPSSIGTAKASHAEIFAAFSGAARRMPPAC